MDYYGNVRSKAAQGTIEIHERVLHEGKKYPAMPSSISPTGHKDTEPQTTLHDGVRNSNK